MTRQEFEYEYSIRKKQSRDFNDLKPIKLLVHELLYCEQKELEEMIKFAKIVEQDLYNKKIIAFPIGHYEDINKINPSTDAGFIQWCLWSLMNRK